MEERIIDRMFELRSMSSEYSKKEKIFKVPSIYDMKMYIRDYYNYLGKEYKVSILKNTIFFTENIPYTFGSLKKEEYTFIKTLDEAVKDQDVFPFLLFMNGKFIKWSNITIVRDTNFSFIIIKDTRYTDEDRCETLVIPDFKLVYKENDVNPTNYSLLFSSSTDLHVNAPTDGAAYTNIFFNNDSTDEYQNMTITNTRFYVDLPEKIEPESVIGFKNGLLLNPSNIKDYGLNVFKYTDVTENQIFTYYGFGFKYEKDNIDNEASIINKDKAVTDLLDETNDDFFTNLYEKFDYEFDFSKTADYNMYECLRYVMDYNATLMSSIYSKSAKIKSLYLDGGYVNNNIQEDGYFHLSRTMCKYHNCYIVVYKNGLLYEYYKLCIHKIDFLMKCIDIKDSDKFEFMYVMDIDNNIYDTRLYSKEMINSENVFKIDPDIDKSNMIILSPTPYEHPYKNLQRNENILYNVDYKYEQVDNEHIKITLDNSFYYDKMLLFGSKKQFRYYSDCNASDEDVYEFLLPDNFRTCGEKSKYMVYKNSVFVPNDEYSISIYNGIDPYFSIQIYLDEPLKPNDRIDVFYIGKEFTNIYNTNSLLEDGIVKVTMKNMRYPFDKNNYFIFSNGRKLLPSEINNIDSHSFAIKTTDKITNNITVIQFIDEIETLSNFFVNNYDLLNSLLHTLSSEDIAKYYGGDKLDIENVENRFVSDKELKDRKLRLVRDYWMKSYIDYGEQMESTLYEDGTIVDTQNNNE